MELDDVRAFVSVVDKGSVSRAARDLYITQSAVTRRLQRLETSLGTTLLDRRSRPIALTGAGHCALERCRRLLSDVREVHAAVSGVGEPTGELRIGVAHALTELTLTEPVDAVRRDFPKTVLRLQTGWSLDLLERVRSGALDASVILLPSGESLPPGLTGQIDGKERLVVVAPRLGNRRRIQAISDLSGVQWILTPEGCAERARLRKSLQRAGVEMSVSVETYNYELQLSLVARNCGLSLVPERVLNRSKFRSRLRILRVAGLEFPLTIWTVHRLPLTGFEPVMAELNRVLTLRLNEAKPPSCAE
jgi:DNA-binding transcriptional LysR family regulator